MGRSLRIKVTLLAFVVGLLFLGWWGYHNAPQRRYAWVLMYHMSYDNDLDRHAEGILEALRRGITNEHVAVLLLVDRASSTGLQRIAMRWERGEVRVSTWTLDREDSADEKEVDAFLEWARRSWPAERYMLTFLNHGGKLHELSVDRRPFFDDARNRPFLSEGKWLHPKKLAPVIAHFHRLTKRKLRLLFFQQCGKGSIQHLIHYVDAAERLMASPHDVGAPNTYYTPMLRLLSQHPDLSVKQLAQSIMRHDKHYLMYTLVSSDALRLLPDKLYETLQPFLRKRWLRPPKKLLMTHSVQGESYVDLGALLRANVDAQQGLGKEETVRFLRWVQTNLILHKKSTPQLRWAQRQTGLSVLVPLHLREWGRYQNEPFYQKTGLHLVFRKWFVR